jgi:phthiodiolone/phenolphthiodiolone dimycocerosates ketoreductase
MERPRIGVAFPNHRTVPLAGIRDFVGALEASGVVDQFWVWDELTGWAPQGFGVPEGVPAPDAHSTHDPFIECAFAVAASAKIGVRMTTDGVRTRPAELTRTLLSLASATEGPVSIAIGLGEVRHMKPFGHPTGQGPSRLKDVMAIMRRLLEADAPFTYEGRRWTIDHGFVGAYRPRRPEIWGLGGGPRFIEICARYADGIEQSFPNSVPNLETFAERVRVIRDQVESCGRDPDQFGFGVWLPTGLHEDPDVITAAQDSPAVKWYSASYGRMNQDEWADEGLQSLMPPGFHYGNDYMPFTMTAAEADAVVARVPREMSIRSATWGTPENAARVAEGFIQAGATFVGLLDLMPMHVGPDAFAPSLGRVLEVAGRIKTGAAVSHWSTGRDVDEKCRDTRLH